MKAVEDVNNCCKTETIGKICVGKVAKPGGADTCARMDLKNVLVLKVFSISQKIYDDYIRCRLNRRRFLKYMRPAAEGQLI